MRKIQSCLRLSTLWCCSQLVPVLSMLILASPAVWAVEPGELYTYQPESLHGQLKINFRYCPTGTIRPEKPELSATGKKLREPVEIRHFFIGQTEVTLAEFRLILGEERLNTIYQKSQQLKASIPDLPAMIKNGQQEPALLVRLEDAIDFCLKIQQQYDQEQSRLEQRSIESFLFRLPSHLEWQYAARAITTADQQLQKPHFSNWVQTADLSKANQEKCNELWKKIGKPGLFPGDQNSFLMLSDVSDPGDLQNLKDIYLEAFSKAFHSEIPRNASGMIDLEQGMPEAGKSLPNAWNISDIHEGVSEWTIWANTLSSQRSLWQSISQKRKRGDTLEGQNSIFLCGGGLSENYYQRRQINRFTVWGGPTLRETNNWEPEPFVYQRTPQGQPFDHVLDYLPGFRIVMEKVLADDWLVLVRRNFFDQRKVSDTAATQISSAVKLAETLVAKDHAVFPVLDFYAALAESKPANRTTILNRAIQVAKQSSAAPESDINSAKNRLAALLNNSKTNKESENDSQKKSDELLYFQVLESVARSK